MSANTLMSVEDYLRLIDKPYREYRDGVATAKAWPALPHSLTQGALLMWLGAQGVQPWPELTVRISPTKYLVPDVCVADDFPVSYPTEPALSAAKFSPLEDRLGSMFSKCEEYHAWGVPYCWVIDPVKCTAWECHADAEPVRVADTLHAGQLSVRLEDLFAELPAES